MWELVQEGLRRDSQTNFPLPASIPDLAPDALDGWQLPFAAGDLAWRAYRDGTQSGKPIRIEAGPHGWRFEFPWPESEPQTHFEASRVAPALEIHRIGPDTVGWQVPSSWLTPPG